MFMHTGDEIPHANKHATPRDAPLEITRAKSRYDRHYELEDRRYLHRRRFTSRVRYGRR